MDAMFMKPLSILRVFIQSLKLQRSHKVHSTIVCEKEDQRQGRREQRGDVTS
ncbi:UNVERIFIED_CONTAM: hypothetical protein FKN15_034359 [Acipenser sinensis]